VNRFSLGIELLNSPNDFLEPAQYASLASLLVRLRVEQKIKWIVGHRDIAPLRKTDPWNLDSEKLLHHLFTIDSSQRWDRLLDLDAPMWKRLWRWLGSSSKRGA
jgi:N-acetyl-anhydromuramyl-L-alanine amidase AmpD